MRASPPSLSAESVFQYDLKREIEIDLDRLRKTAYNDGDVVFILCDHTSIWVHSPLFYVASGGGMPTEFGTVTGKSLNDRGVILTIVSIPEEKTTDIEKIVEACYTQNTLTLLWKAMGGDDVRFSRKDQYADIDTSHINPTLPKSMLPDFEINLRETRGKTDCSPGFSIKVHRFMLDARIDYYQTKTRVGLKLKDHTPMTSNLSRTIFTNFSLWAVAMYVYCGMPSVIFSLDPNLEDYIAESAVHSASPNKALSCNELRAKGLLPAEGIETLLMEISQAANFLLIPELEDWAHYQLYRLAHRFQCSGSGCAETIPAIIEAVYQNDITDEWMFNTGITWLARYENIPRLWKWSLLKKHTVVILLIEKIKDSNTNEEVEKNSLQRVENALELFIRLWRLKQYTEMTSDSKKWDNDLIKPLMDYATEVVLKDVGPATIRRLDVLVNSRSFAQLAGENLLRRVIRDLCIKDMHVKDWRNMEKLIEISVKRSLHSKAPGLKCKPTTITKAPPPLTESQLSYLENQVFKYKRDSVEILGPRISFPDIAKNDMVKKLDSRLKGSAAPFVPRGILMPLNNLGNTPYQMGQPIFSPPCNNHRSPNISDVKNLETPELERSLALSGSDKSFDAIATQAKRQGFKIRRTISTPASRGDKTRELRPGNRGSENRRFTSPTIGGAIPFSQQMKMSSLYDGNR